MSFHFSFTARSDYSARQQLHEIYAPASIKALVETALSSIRWPAPKPPQRINVAGTVNSGEAQQASTGGEGQPAKAREVFGVLVEASGHIADAGGSEIARFVVRPLVD